METWSYAHCLPYFKRMEDCPAAAPDDPWRGHGGPLVLERGPADRPLFEALFEAASEAGYSLTDDVNGYRQEGFAAFDRNIRRGRRLSAARAYLHPVLRRRNLKVRTPGVRDAGGVLGSSGGRRGGAGAGWRLRADRGRRGDPAAGGRSIRHSCSSCRASGLPRCWPSTVSCRRRPAGRRRASAGPSRGLHPARLTGTRVDAAARDRAVAAAVHRRPVAVPPVRARARRITSRRVGSRAPTRTSRTPT